MSFVDPKDPLWREMNSIAEAEGLRLYDLERLPPSHLRVTIDRIASASGNVGVDVGSETGEQVSSSANSSESGLAGPVRERVTSGDCSKLCRRLMAYFLVSGQDFGISTEPEIEVSSPGINRNLRRMDHFVEAIGERVKVVSMRDYEGPEKFPIVGKLIAADNETLRMEIEGGGGEAVLPLDGVKKAHVDFRFD